MSSLTPGREGKYSLLDGLNFDFNFLQVRGDGLLLPLPVYVGAELGLGRS